MRECLMPFRRRNAFTMVELVFVAGLVALIAVVSARVFTAFGVTQQTLSNQAILQMDARKAFDTISEKIRSGTDVIKPVAGETLPYLIFKDATNYVNTLYLEADNQMSKKLQQKLYKLILYRDDYSGGYRHENEKVMFRSIKKLSFTSPSPTCVQLNVTIVGETGEYQFLSLVGLMNLGGLK